MYGDPKSSEENQQQQKQMSYSLACGVSEAQFLKISKMKLQRQSLEKYNQMYSDPAKVTVMKIPNSDLRERRQHGTFPMFQSGVVCSSSRSSLQRRSVSPYQVRRFGANLLIWERFRLSDRSIVGSLVSVHAVWGHP